MNKVMEDVKNIQRRIWYTFFFFRLRRRGARGLEWPGRTVPEGVVVEQGVGLEGHSIVSNVFD